MTRLEFILSVLAVSRMFHEMDGEVFAVGICHRAYDWLELTDMREPFDNLYMILIDTFMDQWDRLQSDLQSIFPSL